MTITIQPNATRRLAFATLLTLLIPCGFGCGGGGNTNNASTTATFRGTYLGTFTLDQPGSTQTGTLTGTVANGGTFNGAATNLKLGTTATITGNFLSGGQTTITLTYPDATFTATGNSAIGANGHLLSSLTETQGTTTIGPLTFDLTPQ